MRQPDFCICENKDADQLCGNREAYQRLCFCYIDSTIPLVPKNEISSLVGNPEDRFSHNETHLISNITLTRLCNKPIFTTAKKRFFFLFLLKT